MLNKLNKFLVLAPTVHSHPPLPREEEPAPAMAVDSATAEPVHRADSNTSTSSASSPGGFSNRFLKLGFDRVISKGGN
ncbi:hypothetical protein VTN49DRAFT_2680 [Thermomyces lanuginosus]|uniref:uncharacterized protein n=1 Tax=Thermomyces lanuginosus TaxID=5541 RepID=UPI0037446973